MKPVKIITQFLCTQTKCVSFAYYMHKNWMIIFTGSIIYFMKIFQIIFLCNLRK